MTVTSNRPAAVFWACVAVVGLCLLSARPAAAQNTKAQKAAADRALVKERFCEAVYLYEALNKVEPSTDNVVAAADAADRADDRNKAVQLYKTALNDAGDSHPRYRYLQQQLDGLNKRLAKGSGSTCTKPAPECGNGLVEGSETCDDGNTNDADTCPRLCVVEGQAAAAPVVAVVPVPPLNDKSKKKTEAKPEPKPEAKPPEAPVVVEPAEKPSEEKKLCTLIKPVKWFSKGKWDTLTFGTTIGIKSAGPQWTMVDGPGGDGKIKGELLVGACGTAESSDDNGKVAAAAAGGVLVSSALASRDDNAADAGPAASTTEPSPVVEPDATPEAEEAPPPAPAVAEAPAAETPATTVTTARIDSTEKSGGFPIGGIALLGAGVVLAGGGGAVATYAAFPLLEARTLTAQQNQLANDYANEDNAKDLAEIAHDADRTKTKLDNITQRFNNEGRFIVLGGAVALGIGVSMVVGGLIWTIAGLTGGEAEAE